MSLPEGVLVPGAGVAHLGALLDEGSPVKIADGETYLGFQQGMVTVFMRKQQGDFPAVERIYPLGSTTVASVDVKEMEGTLKRMQASAMYGGGRYVEFTFTARGCLVKGAREHGGSGEEELEAIVEGDDISVPLPPGPMLEALGTFDGGRVQLRMTTDQSAVVLTPADPDAERLYYIVMPMRRT